MQLSGGFLDRRLHRCIHEHGDIVAAVRLSGGDAARLGKLYRAGMMSYWMELINIASLVKVCLWFLGTIESGLSMHCLAVLGGAFLAFLGSLVQVFILYSAYLLSQSVGYFD